MITQSFCSELEVADVLLSLTSPLIKGRRNTKTAPHRSSRTATPRKRANMMSDAVRKEFLESDQWARHVHPRSVTCRGCCKVISLDRRTGAFYADRWLKHRSRCRAIKRHKGREIEVSAKLSDYQSHLFKFNYKGKK
jgi:hypothetical protein